MPAQTDKTIGTAARDYATPQAWEAARGGNLAGENRYEVGIMYNDSLFDEQQIIFDGNTVDKAAGEFMHLTVAEGERHSGQRFTTSGVRISPDSYQWAVDNRDNWSLIEWVQVKAEDAYSACFNDTAGGGSDRCKFYNCIAYAPSPVSDTTYGFRLWGDSPSSLVENCLAYGPGLDIGINIGEGAYGYNCVAHKCVDGFTNSDAAGRVRNCVGINNSNEDFETAGSPWTSSDYNLDGDGSAPGANSVHNKTDTNQFVNLTLGSEDYHLKSGSDALTVGVGPSADANVPTTDIDGDTRSGATCDIGADEANRPTIVSIVPNTDTTAGGAFLDITVTNVFDTQGSGSLVIGGNTVSISDWADQLIKGPAPAHAIGQVNVVLTNSRGFAVTEVNGFEYTAIVSIIKDQTDGVSLGIGLGIN